MKGATYLDFDKATAKALKLIRNENDKTFGLLIICGINLGLRISDLLSLTFADLRDDTIKIKEQKTNKLRVLKVNDSIKQALIYFEDMNDNFHCFRSQKGSIYSSQHVNRLLKKHFNKDTSSHSLRKTFGRRVWENNGESDKALTYLSDIFNHKDTATTRIYLGIRQEEIDDIYMSL